MDAFLHLIVQPEDNMELSGNNVISKLHISLLESLKGCTKEVKTVLGNKNLIACPLSKNKDQVEITKAGVNNIGFIFLIWL